MLALDCISSLRAILPKDYARPSGECMNKIYEVLEAMPLDMLQDMWNQCSPSSSGHDAFLRYQIAFVVSRR